MRRYADGCASGYQYLEEKKLKTEMHCLTFCFLLAVTLLILFCTGRRWSISCLAPRRLYATFVLPPIRGRILHLPDRRDREHNVQNLIEEAGKANVLLEVFEAVDGRRCADVKVRPFPDFSQLPRIRDHLRGGEQGCTASYMKMWGEGMGPAFYVEDDAVMRAEGFAIMSALLHQHAQNPYVFFGSRSFPGGWPDKPGLASSELSAETCAPGWHSILAPNYSTACFALTEAASRDLAIWIRKQGDRANLPADDLLSVACGVHPHRLLHEPPLRGFAPIKPLSSRIPTMSDTEIRMPAGEACDLLLTVHDDV